MATEITVPDIGDFKDVEVIDVLVKPGDTIDVETPLLTLETEKATMDVPSTSAGVVKSVAVKKGDRISKGSEIVSLEVSGGRRTADSERMPSEGAAATSVSASSQQPAASGPTAVVDASVSFSSVHASPSVRKFARELGADSNRIKGPGIKGRITPDDVKAWVKQALTSGGAAAGGAGLPKIPEVDFSKFGEIEVKPLGRIQKTSGPRLQAS